jgi:hypothetical protein
MRLPVGVTNAPSFQSALNALWAKPLSNIYPAANFAASSSTGAPGDPGQQRVYPTGNQATDPRSTSGGAWSLVPTNTSALMDALNAPRVNIGGNSYGATAAAPSGSMGLLLPLAALGLLLFLVMRRA